MAPVAQTRSGRKSRTVAAAATQIVQEALREDVSVGDLAQLAEADPGFAVRLLTLVNSPSFGGRSVRTIHQASSLLGIRGLRNLALSLVVNDMAPTGPDGQELMTVSLRRAVAARKVGELLAFPDLDACFTTGLLLEVGLLRQASEFLSQAADIARAPSADRVVLERAAGWGAHPEGGAGLAEELGLPFDMVAAIRHHHDEECPTTPLARVAWAAEATAAVFEAGVHAQLYDRARAVAEQLGLTAGIDELLEALPGLVEEGARAFKRDVGPQPELADLVRDANRALVDLNSRYSELIRTLENLVAEKEALTEELRGANEKLAAIALTDPLTGIPNKRALTEELARSLARADREETALALVVVDIDHFKGFNDTYGHAVGDEVLKAVATTLAQSARTSDFAARYGGEEFVLILPSTSGPGAKILADRLRKAVAAARAEGPNGALQVTASFGVAHLRGPGCKGEADALFRRADAALYRAKDSGRNCVVLG